MDPCQYRAVALESKRIGTARRTAQPPVALTLPSLHDAGNYKQSEAEFREGSWRGRLPGAWLRKRATISLWSRAYPSVSAVSSLCRMCHLWCRVARSYRTTGPNAQACPLRSVDSRGGVQDTTHYS